MCQSLSKLKTHPAQGMSIRSDTVTCGVINIGAEKRKKIGQTNREVTTA
jgi:hypothetical protein